MKRLGELSKLVNGNVSGDENLVVNGAASIARALPTEITFITSEKHLGALLSSHAAAVVIPSTLKPEIRAQIRRPVITVDNAETGFSRIVMEFRPPVERGQIGISHRAIVNPSAKIADNVNIYPGAFIGDEVEIGAGSTIFPNVTILERCKIGENVRIFPSAVLYTDTIVGDRSIIHAAAVLGAFGFGYKTHEGMHRLSSQLGNVEIGTDVEIGAGSTIDRGSYESTTIGDGTKIDDQVMVGHNCRIGPHNLLCSQVGIAGSSTTGVSVTMAGQVGVGDHLSIGDKVILHAKSGVMSDVEEGQQLLGTPAAPIRQQMQVLAVSNKLPEMRRQMKALARQVLELTEQIAGLESPADQPSISEPTNVSSSRRSKNEAA